MRSPRTSRGRARSRRGRRVAAPTARGMGAGLLRFRCAQAFRVSKGHKKRGSSHAAAHTAGPRSPHQPSGGSEGSRALRAVFRIPGSFSKSSIWRRNPARARDRLHASSGRPASLTCAADSAALRQQGYLTPAAACAGRERVPSGHLGRRPKATCRREQIQGLRAASAQNADICEGSETMSAPKGSVSPVGCCAKRKATRRRTAKRAVGAPRALRDD